MSDYYISSNFGQQFTLNSESSDDLKIIDRDGDQLRILFKNEIKSVQILEENYQERYIRLIIDGVVFRFDIENEIDKKVRDMGMEKTGASKIDRIESPMPGLVLEVLVSEGDEVKKGDPLIILEAMKMENIIKAPADGTIELVKVKLGASVEKKEVLLKME